MSGSDVSMHTKNFRSLANSYGPPEAKTWFSTLGYILVLNLRLLWDSNFLHFHRFWPVRLRSIFRDWFMRIHHWKALLLCIINTKNEFFCNGKISFGDRFFHCWKTKGHGEMNLEHAIQESCDVFFYNVIQKIRKPNKNR